jgi:hypothetical protein
MARSRRSTRTGTCWPGTACARTISAAGVGLQSSMTKKASALRTGGG